MPRLPTLPHNVRQIRFITYAASDRVGEEEEVGGDSLPCNSRPTDAMERRIKSNINVFHEARCPNAKKTPPPLAIFYYD